MQQQLPLFIYLDSKIVGSALQICAFFDIGVFDKSKTTVLVKKYKHKSRRIIRGIFDDANIQYRFVLDGDLDELSSGVIFYPFNAQSNCRAVANRNLTHIFITHGESNKVSSIKPIIRIYDYVITAGQAGIERYLASGIFSQYDVDAGRIIMLGDTFIGRTGLAKQGVGQEVVFYAPTWEGGIERENYSSLSYVDKVAKTLIDTAKHHCIDTIVIKPHPNTGHRLKHYVNYLYQLVKYLKANHLTIIIFKPHLKLTWLQSLKYQKLDVLFVNSLVNYHAKVGFCDISAIETQFLNEGILYYLFFHTRYSKSLWKNHAYYRNALIDFFGESKIHPLINSDFLQLKKHMICQELNDVSLSQRIPFFTNQFTK